MIFDRQSDSPLNFICFQGSSANPSATTENEVVKNPGRYTCPKHRWWWCERSGLIIYIIFVDQERSSQAFQHREPNWPERSALHSEGEEKTQEREDQETCFARGKTGKEGSKNPGHRHRGLYSVLASFLRVGSPQSHLQTLHQWSCLQLLPLARILQLHTEPHHLHCLQPGVQAGL